jgi:hypothetical protein
MRCPARTALFAAILLIGWSSTALAGMGAPTLADVPRVRSLSDLARMRLEVVSFFGLGLLLCAACIRWIWNGLAKDFVRLPRLSYGKALGVVMLWGLLFLLVLTMISGARELMTPGAWEKVGMFYRLAPEPPPIETEITKRYEAISRLAEALNSYGETHGRRYPTREEISAALWIVPGTDLAVYLYTGGEMPDPETYEFRGDPNQSRIVAVEPASVGRDRLALFRDGGIVWVSGDRLDALMRPDQPR